VGADVAPALPDSLARSCPRIGWHAMPAANQQRTVAAPVNPRIQLAAQGAKRKGVLSR
jgi:hypothetical protein